jgi:plastocyanin
MFARIILLAAGLILASAATAQPAEFTIVIKNHRFEPAELTVPAGQKIKLIIDNQDDSAEEFESNELKREKIVAPLSKITVFIGPLEPGRYPYFGEFHMDTALGTIIAK